MVSSTLPVELTDRVIDFCHDDKRTLSKCALTHSSWLATSRLHLFHTITTGVREGTDREIQLKSTSHKSSFVFSHRRSFILPYIRTVKIKSFHGFAETLRLGNAVDLADTIRWFCHLENLPAPSVHVNLTKFRQFSLFSNQPLQSFSPVSNIVTHVTLLDVTFAHPNGIWSFLSSFPRLQHLELERIGFNPSSGPSLPAGGIFDGVPLSTMRLTTASMGLVISSLVRMAGSLSHLDDFGIAYQDIRQEELPQLAGAIQRRVKCLRFSASCYPGDERDDEWRPSAFDIRIPEFVGCFCSLQTLVLDNLRVYRSDVSFEWITGVLQQLSSPVQKLVFEVTATDCSQLNAIPWAFIDRIVSPEIPQFGALIGVEVLVKRRVRQNNYPSSIGKDVVCSEIIVRLPTLNLLGLLRCNTVLCE